MIELLGIGVPSHRGEWLFRRLCARIERPELVAVVASDPDVRVAVLDGVAGRRIPSEGRVWVNGRPLTKETRARHRSRVVEVDLRAELLEHRSLLTNVQLGPRGRLQRLERWRRRLSTSSRRAAEHAIDRAGLQRLSRERVSALGPTVRRRALIAHALTSKPEVLIVREVECGLSLSDAADVLAALRVLVACDRVTVLISTAETILVQMFAERVLAIVDGDLRFNGPPSTSLAASFSMHATSALPEFIPTTSR